MRLSVRRAAEVRNALRTAGVAPGLVSSEGLGESRPIIRTGDNVKEAGNRLVRIEITR
jgi:outer membrane protein OmpA-like peptidoglycan-associated protein